MLRALEASHGVSWADFDRDGDLDLSLTGSASTASHPLLRNGLPRATAARALQIAVADSRQHARFAGAEVRVYAAGTRRLIGLRLVDSGSGYNTQNAMPVHVAIPRGDRVDVEVRTRQDDRVWQMRDVEVARYARRILTMRASR